LNTLIVGSDQKAHSAESGSAHDDWSPVHSPLSLSHEGHLVHVLVVLVLSIDLISQEGLEQIVELILAQIRGTLLEQGVHPVSVRGSVSEFVVVNDPKSISQGLSIDKWVQSVPGRIEDAQTRSVGTSILLLGEVLVELGGSELLVALGLLVLTGLELRLEVFDVCLKQGY